MQLCHVQPTRTGAYSVIQYDAGVETNYTFITKYGDTVKMAQRHGDTLWLPRESVGVGIFDHRVSNLLPAIDCNFTPVNDEQQPLAETSIDLLKSGVNHCFEAPTGWGKSVVGAYIALQMCQPTIIIVPKEDLMDSWYDAIVNVLGIDPSLVGKVQQNTCDWKGKRIVIAMLHSIIIPDRYPEDMYRYFGMVLWDECHMVAADSFINSCWKFPAKYRLGFSATPDRSDGKQLLIEAHIGQIRVRGKLVPMAPKVLVKETGWKIPYGVQYSPGRMMSVYKQMAENTERNQIMVDFVLSAYKAERHVVMMADTLDHLDRMFQLLTSAGISGEKIGYYVGGMKKVELDQNKKRSVVLATYKMCETGTNVPSWDSLVMMNPRAKVKQAIGRVMRMVAGKKQPVILDLRDANKVFASYYHARQTEYYAVKATIINL